MTSEKSDESGNFKEMTANYPSSAMAAGRVGVEFVDEPKPSTAPEMDKHREGATVRSNTGQLAWTAKDEKGWFSIDTAGTQAAVGFMPKGEIELGDVTFASETAFCGLYLTSLDREKGIGETDQLLLSAIARVRNTGMRFNADMTRLLQMGKAPVLVEPVVATVRIPGREVVSVELLDHDGLPTGKSLPVEDGTFRIDGARDRTPYYRVILR
jgi:hypothetical protein